MSNFDENIKFENSSTDDGFCIGNVPISKRLLLAPMAGYGDKAFREMCRDGGAGMSCTEMISCKGLIYKNQQTRDMLSKSNVETPCAVQLFGKVPEDFEKAVQDPLLEKFDIIDINMGCPVNKVIKHGEGSELMETPEIAADIVKACVKASNGRPVTVKHRLGLKWGDNTSIDFAKRLEDAGVSALAIHGRYQQQMYKGESDWDAIAAVANAVNIPIIGSGDIVDSDGYKNAIKSPVAAVMIARGAIGNPTVFDDILKGDEVLSPLKVIRLCKKHLELHLQYVKKENAVAIFKKHFASYITTFKKVLNNNLELKLAIQDATGDKYSTQYINDLKQKVHSVDNVEIVVDILSEMEMDFAG